MNKKKIAFSSTYGKPAKAKAGTSSKRSKKKVAEHRWVRNEPEELFQVDAKLLAESSTVLQRGTMVKRHEGLLLRVECRVQDSLLQVSHVVLPQILEYLYGLTNLSRVGACPAEGGMDAEFLDNEPKG